MNDKRDPVDVHVGIRLRLRRTLLGMSQEKLAEAVGLTFQQIQKYEKGANRVGASRMYQFSQILDVPPSFFFDGIEETLARTPGSGRWTGPSEAESLGRRQALNLVRAYHGITDGGLRRRLLDLVKALAAQSGSEVADNGI